MIVQVEGQVTRWIETAALDERAGLPRSAEKALAVAEAYDTDGPTMRLIVEYYSARGTETAARNNVKYSTRWCYRAQSMNCSCCR